MGRLSGRDIQGRLEGFLRQEEVRVPIHYEL